MMPINRVVINASPLITLFASQQDYLLPELFDEIYIPDAVWNEVVVAGNGDRAAQKIPSIDWLIKLPSVTVDLDIQRWNLGAGESEVMHHSRKLETDRAIVDDLAARRCCKSLEIRSLGTCGILVVAKRRGLISNLESAIQKLRDAGLWLSDSLVVSLIDQANTR